MDRLNGNYWLHGNKASQATAVACDPHSTAEGRQLIGSGGGTELGVGVAGGVGRRRHL
jgi:hypothetical protein